MMVLNSKGLFTWSSADVKHANTVHILDFDGPKQTGRMQWDETCAWQWPIFTMTPKVERSLALES